MGEWGWGGAGQCFYEDVDRSTLRLKHLIYLTLFNAMCETIVEIYKYFVLIYRTSYILDIIHC